MARNALLIGLLLGLSFAVSDDGPPDVRLDIQIGSDDYSVGLDGLTLRVDDDQPINLRLRVFDPTDETSAVDVEEPSTLLEVRVADDPGSGVRFDDWEHVGTGVYTVADALDDPGEYLLVVLPDVTERSRLPASSTDQVTLIVESVAPAVSETPTMTGLLVALILVLVVGVLVVLTTRGRRRVAKEPTPHDTWWNSP